MRRLRDGDERSPLLDKARELLDAVDSLPNVELRRARVRAAIEQSGRSAPPRRVPALALALVLSLIGASAFAAVRIYGAVRSYVESEPADTNAGHTKRKRTVERVARNAQVANEAQAKSAAPKSLGATELEQADVARPRRTKPARNPVKAERNSDLAVEQDAVAPELEPRPDEQKRKLHAAAEVRASQSAIVHRALSALRRDRDPHKALLLLDELARQSLDGPLREEAHALQIEAAIEVDRTRARTLAREYLERFPAGRYRSLAGRALGE